MGFLRKSGKSSEKPGKCMMHGCGHDTRGCIAFIGLDMTDSKTRALDVSPSDISWLGGDEDLLMLTEFIGRHGLDKAVDMTEFTFGPESSRYPVKCMMRIPWNDAYTVRMSFSTSFMTLHASYYLDRDPEGETSKKTKVSERKSIRRTTREKRGRNGSSQKV